MLKKVIFGLVLVLIITTTGASCNCTNTTDKSKLPNISLTIWGPVDEATVYEPIIDRYVLQMQNQANISINYVKKDYAEYESISLNALAAGSGPDIWIIKNDWVDKHADKLVPMPDGVMQKNSSDTRTNIAVYEDTFPQIAIDDNIIDGNIYGMPFSIDTLALYYNKDQFKNELNALYKEKRNNEAKLFELPPNNWDEFITMATLLTKKDDSGNITRSGAAMGTANNIDYATDILAVLMMQNQTQMTSADKLTATFNLPVTKDSGEPAYTGTQALSFYTSFADSSKDNYSWNIAMPDSLDAFIAGKASMMLNYASAQQRISQEAPTLNYGIGPLPQVSGATTSIDFASYWTNTVTNNSQNPDEAWKFINYVFNNKLDTYLAATGLPSAKKINILSVPKTKERVTYGDDPFKYQIMSAKYWYRGKYPSKVASAFYQMIQDVIVNKEALQKSIDKAAATVTELYKMSVQNTSSSSTSPSPTTSK